MENRHRVHKMEGDMEDMNKRIKVPRLQQRITRLLKAFMIALSLFGAIGIFAFLFVKYTMATGIAMLAILFFIVTKSIYENGDF